MRWLAFYFREIMIICKTTNRVFSDFNYEKVSFAGDLVEACPRCRKFIYAKEFEQEHEFINVNPHIKLKVSDLFF